MTEDVIMVETSKYYNNAPGEEEMILNEGHWTINEGQAAGKSIGGNFLTSNFILGSGFMPGLDDCILFMEENHIMNYKDIQNELQSILNQGRTESIRGLIMGRFQRKSGITRELLTKMVKSKEELADIPV